MSQRKISEHKNAIRKANLDFVFGYLRPPSGFFLFAFFFILLFVNIHSQPSSGLFWYALCGNLLCHSGVSN